MNSRRLQAALTAGFLLVLAAALAAGCGGPSGTAELGSGQDGTAPAGAGDSGGETAAMIVNDAISDQPHPAGSSAAADPGGSSATEPGAPDVPSGESTRTGGHHAGHGPVFANGLHRDIDSGARRGPCHEGDRRAAFVRG